MPANWTPTATFRWFKPLRPGSEYKLQQMWIRDGWYPEWRDIDVVIEGEDDDQ